MEKGTLFLFCGSRADRIKGILFEDDGMLLLSKVLYGGNRYQWPRSPEEASEITPEQFQWIRDENTALKKENSELLKQNRELTDRLQMRSRDLYGRKSEQASGIVDTILDETPEDPLAESILELAPDSGQADAGAAAYRSKAWALRQEGGRKTRGRSQQDVYKDLL